MTSALAKSEEEANEHLRLVYRNENAQKQNRSTNAYRCCSNHEYQKIR